MENIFGKQVLKSEVQRHKEIIEDNKVSRILDENPIDENVLGITLNRSVSNFDLLIRGLQNKGFTEMYDLSEIFSNKHGEVLLYKGGLDTTEELYRLRDTIARSMAEGKLVVELEGYSIVNESENGTLGFIREKEFKELVALIRLEEYLKGEEIECHRYVSKNMILVTSKIELQLVIKFTVEQYEEIVGE